MRTSKTKVAVFCSLALLGAGDFLGAQSLSEPDVLQRQLRAVPAADISAKAAELVAKVPAEQRNSAAVAVVRAAIQIAPGATAEVSAAVAAKAPDAAPEIAAAAVAASPKLAPAIAARVASASPAQAAKVVCAVCKKQPSQYAKVGKEVARAMPKANGQAVLTGIVDALPNLKLYMDRAKELAAANGSAFVTTEKVLTYLTALVDRARNPGLLSLQPVSVPSLGGSAEGPSSVPAASAIAVINSEPPGVPGYAKPADNTVDDAVNRRGKRPWQEYSGP